MLKNFFLITLRSMMKNKLFIIINVVGMGIAIANATVAYFALTYDMSFDSVHERQEQIYRVTAQREFNENVNRHGFVPFPLYGVVASNGDVNRATRVFRSYSNFKRDNDLFGANLSYVDIVFFQMFSFRFLVGEPGLHDKASVVVSESIAVRLFGSAEEAYGKAITQVYGNELKELRISGVYAEPPMNSSFYLPNGSSFCAFDNYKDEFTDIRDDDWRKLSQLYVEIQDASRVAVVQEQLQTHREKINTVREDFQVASFTLDPLTTMAHVDRRELANSGTWDAPPISAIIGSNVMGVMIILIACFNLTNTSIAIASRRLKEIGIRKVMGSVRHQLIVQFIAETTFMCLLALLLGLALTDWLVQGWNLLWEFMQLTPDYTGDPKLIGFLLCILLVTGLLAGSYPAFYISRFSPVAILKGKVQFGGTNMFTRFLLGAQFAISLIAIVSAIGLIQNARYQKSYDLGFDIRGTVLTWLSDPSEFETYRNALASNPKIESIAGARSGIFSSRSRQPIKYMDQQTEVDLIEVGDQYLKTMNLTLVKGRDFQKDSKTDEKESILVTEKLASLFGWEEPLGKEIVYQDSIKLYVVGVVKDVYNRGVWRELQPMMIRFVLPEQYTQLAVNTKVENVVEVNDYMRAKWNEVFPSRLYNGFMMGEDLNEAVEVNQHIVYMFVFVGVVALLLSATGLYSLVSLNIIKRMKEIGVRKVLGASVGNITRIVNMEFVVILVIASVAGCALSYWMINMLMGSIWTYYQSLSLASLLASTIVMFLISFSAIGYRVFSAANMNPVNTLKTE